MRWYELVLLQALELLQILARLRRGGTWTSWVTELVNSSGRVASP